MKKIKLTRGKFVVVDNDVFEYLNQWKWCYGGGYAMRRQYLGGGRKNSIYKNIYMHRLINNTPENLFTDHINRDKLDNRRVNLRSVTKSENSYNTNLLSQNTSGYRGVSWDKNRNLWKASIQMNGKTINLGRFKIKEDAYKAYVDEANKRVPNFINL